ncbi:MAG TPA: malic enzyme-like NAD(P)-binding protein [Steroidobacteraceae bacterium]|nr:malic enzyme-like NAD(P)-binding protein [Steroidobacteraceae bacterium]
MKVPEILIVETVHQPGSLAKVLQVIADAGLTIDHLQALRREQGRTLWEITLEMDEEADRSLYGRIDALPAARFVGKSDRVFDRHRGGKIRTESAIPITTQQVLRDIYTPGVARVCLAIHRDPALAWDYTSLGNSVAVVTNGTAVLGLGNIGALAGLPVMEGKAALFSTLVGIHAVPILLDETDPARCVDHIAAIASGFGAIQLEDFAAPACFEIEAALRERLPRPVLHDDQHGTAVVVLAAALNATRRAGRELGDCVVGQVGLGAAGIGIVRLLQCAGARRVLGTDLDAAAMKRLAAMGGEPSTLAEIMGNADIVVATTGARGLIKPAAVRKGQIIMALSNPDPEIEPADALAHGAAIAADGKGINNLLGFPGLFKGALEARAARFTDAMLLAAAQAIAELARGQDLVPDPLDRAVHQAVAAAVSRSSRSGAS